ncbi:uncharacterized protein LOC143034550 [Oratosquilla oratoria]|uniref:uncharacterized protein LOC143034550 n=1 Tax=Oratosquilla oratoria TaxID=337810 RepID=UPI003F76F438
MTDDQQQEVSAFRAPPFSNRDPTIWFTILECNFKANRITTSLTKFSHACGLLPSDVLLQVSDTISKAPTSGTPYEDLKKAVLDRLESSEATRLQELLSKEELGNEKPSDLLRRMKRLLGDKYATFDTSILRHLFYQRLPTTIQGNLFSAKNKLSLDELATLADEFMASVPVARPTIANLADQSATQALTELVSKLTLQIEELIPIRTSRSSEQNRLAQVESLEKHVGGEDWGHKRHQISACGSTSMNVNTIEIVVSLHN